MPRSFSLMYSVSSSKLNRVVGGKKIEPKQSTYPWIIAVRDSWQTTSGGGGRVKESTLSVLKESTKTSTVRGSHMAVQVMQRISNGSLGRLIKMRAISVGLGEEKSNRDETRMRRFT